MEIILAKKISELSNEELISLLMSIKMQDMEAYQLIKEKIEEML
jgi:hypothetical protein